jgi:radical SAM protein with 4Fe4S-binding SPASM domain
MRLSDGVRAIDATSRPTYVVWELTLRCDLACRHCSSRAGLARDDELDTDEALDVVAQLADLGVGEVTLIGGEAYLRDDWTRIVGALRDEGIDVTMVTGGRGMTAERARMAKECGVQSASVSVDGLSASHDALRGVVGSFDSAMNAIANLRAAGVAVSANTQIGRTNVRDIEPLLDVIGDAGAHSWQLQITVAMGRAADAPHLLLEPFHMIEAMPMLARVKERADRAGVRIWPGNNIGYFGPYESTLRSMQPECRRGSCLAGRTSMGIESNGDVKGCPSLPAEYVGGNVRRARMVDIWERSAQLRFGRDRTVDELWGECARCYYAEECMAGCTWTAHSLFGRRGNNPFCHHRALQLLDRGRRERLERRQAPPGAPFDLGRFDLIEEEWPASMIDRARDVAAGREHWLLEDPSSEGRPS